MISCMTATCMTTLESPQNLLNLTEDSDLPSSPASQEAPNLVPVIPDVPYVHDCPPSLNPAPKLSKKCPLKECISHGCFLPRSTHILTHKVFNTMPLLHTNMNKTRTICSDNQWEISIKFKVQSTNQTRWTIIYSNLKVLNILPDSVHSTLTPAMIFKGHKFDMQNSIPYTTPRGSWKSTNHTHADNGIIFYLADSNTHNMIA